MKKDEGKPGKDLLLPHARRENLLLQEMSDELLVYDLKTNKAHCLNQAASLTWKSCDGEKTVADIAGILSIELKARVDDDVVWLALGQLSRARLLAEQLPRPVKKSGLSRREVIRRMGLGTAIALPAVISIVAPTAASAASCIANGGFCAASGLNFNSKCCSGCCTLLAGCQSQGVLGNGSPCLENCQCKSGHCSIPSFKCA